MNALHPLIRSGLVSLLQDLKPACGPDQTR